LFPIVSVDSRRAVTLEPLGTKRKFWFRGRDNVRTLFKAEERGTGEDWAEKIACELCALLGLPHVHYELAHDMVADVPGVVCETCTPKPRDLMMGNQLMQALDPEYPQGTKYKVKAHTVDAVASVVELLRPPIEPFDTGWPAGIHTSLDVFVGYVMLDAWIANQDRHHENWAAVFDLEAAEGSRLSLSPSFDHGASLARNLRDEERKERMTSRDKNRQMPAFAGRARSAFYADPSDSKTMLTVEAFDAFARRRPDAAKIWLEQLSVIDQSAWTGILDRIAPQRMSRVARDFTSALLAENRRRLLERQTT